MDSLEDQLRDLMNQCSAENDSNTPDFILANFMFSCLCAFNEAAIQRDAWYGSAAKDGPPETSLLEAQWQPIETAARDGTRILAIDADGDMMVVEYYVGSDGRAFWEIARNELEQYFAGRTLTHWMPLPEPPKESK